MEKDKYDIKEDLAMRIFRTIYYRQIEDMRYIKFSNKDDNINNISEETIQGFINSLTFEEGFTDNDAFAMCYNMFDGMFDKDARFDSKYFSSQQDYDNYLTQTADAYASGIMQIFVRDNAMDSLNRNILWYLTIAEKNQTYTQPMEQGEVITKSEEVRVDQSQQVEEQVENVVEEKQAENKLYTIQDLYKNASISATNEYYDKLIQCYTSYDNKASTLDYKDVVYRALNSTDRNNQYKFDENERGKFLKEIASDVNASGIEGFKSPKEIQAGWFTYQSWNLIGGEKIKADEIQHKFYISVRPDKLHKLEHALYSKYKEKGIPFYFKSNADAEKNCRKDNLVIYVTNEDLQANLEILSEIKQEYEDIVSTCDTPSLVVGQADNWLGYVSESNKAHKPHTDIMSTALATAFDNAIQEANARNPFLYKNMTLDKLMYNDLLVAKKQAVKWLSQKRPDLLYKHIQQQLELSNLNTNNIT